MTYYNHHWLPRRVLTSFPLMAPALSPYIYRHAHALILLRSYNNGRTILGELACSTFPDAADRHRKAYNRDCAVCSWCAGSESET